VIKADEAFGMNLVNRVVPGAAIESMAKATARRIAAFDPKVVARLKQMAHSWDDLEGRSVDVGHGQVE
jgi:enoyl-CoA hydratase/carnithine racemase